MKKIVLPIFAVLLLAVQLEAATIFTENMGTPSGTTAIASNTFQNPGLTFSGTGDVRTSSASTGYTGASASGNVFLTNSGTSTFIISGIDTSAYSAGTLDLSFGAYKSTTASNMSELTLEYSSNGTSWTTLTLPTQATGSGTANWRLISFVDTAMPITSTLYIRWTDSASGTGTPQFRIDDVTLEGTLAPVPEPSTYALMAFGVIALAWLRRRQTSKQTAAVKVSQS